MENLTWRMMHTMGQKQDMSSIQGFLLSPLLQQPGFSQNALPLILKVDPGHEEFDYVAHIRRIGQDYEESSMNDLLPAKTNQSMSSGKAGSVSSETSRKRPAPMLPAVQPVHHLNLSAALKGLDMAPFKIDDPGTAMDPMDLGSDNGFTFLFDPLAFEGPNDTFRPPFSQLLKNPQRSSLNLSQATLTESRGVLLSAPRPINIHAHNLLGQPPSKRQTPLLLYDPYGVPVSVPGSVSGSISGSFHNISLGPSSILSNSFARQDNSLVSVAEYFGGDTNWNSPYDLDDGLGLGSVPGLAAYVPAETPSQPISRLGSTVNDNTFSFPDRDGLAVPLLYLNLWNDSFFDDAPAAMSASSHGSRPPISARNSFQGTQRGKLKDSRARKDSIKETPRPSVPSNGNLQNDRTECTNCHTRTTPLWRRNPEGEPLCNACGLFLKLHGTVRPLSLKTDVIKKRARTADKKKDTRKPETKAEPKKNTRKGRATDGDDYNPTPYDKEQKKGTKISTSSTSKSKNKDPRRQVGPAVSGKKPNSPAQPSVFLPQRGQRSSSNSPVLRTQKSQVAELNSVVRDELPAIDEKNAFERPDEEGKWDWLSMTL